MPSTPVIDIPDEEPGHAEWREIGVGKTYPGDPPLCICIKKEVILTGEEPMSALIPHTSHSEPSSVPYYLLVPLLVLHSPFATIQLRTALWQA